jgi:hydroxymethylbilane synthase
MSDIEKIRIGIRSSQLSTVQTNQFIERLISFYPRFNKKNIIIKYIKTSGDIHQHHRLDQIGGKGLFIHEIEECIINGEIDLGVHSMKDMPGQLTDNLEIACWLPRYDARDVLVTNNNVQYSIQTLPPGSVVGTSSIRRRSQILNQRRDLQIKSIRGNIDTRLKKLKNGEYDAIVLAHAGLLRLDITGDISQIFEKDSFIPAACQGTVGIQTLSNNEQLKNLLKPVNDPDSELCCVAEREVLNIIGANCNSPIGVLAEIEKENITICAQLFDHAGQSIFYSSLSGRKNDNKPLAQQLGHELIDKVGMNTIKQLDKLENDFNYTPKE